MVDESLTILSRLEKEDSVESQDCQADAYLLKSINLSEELDNKPVELIDKNSSS
jgi:hypothetical protein